jgi:hypothetical protein
LRFYLATGSLDDEDVELLGGVDAHVDDELPRVGVLLSGVMAGSGARGEQEPAKQSRAAERRQADIDV